MRKWKGFTLLELIVVIIIVGILATLGFVQYTRVIEKGRRAEAASILGTIRSMATIWNQEGGHATAYPASAYLISDLTLPTTATCDAQHYFYYTIDSTTGTATATRCAGAAGKQPGGVATDNMTLTIGGVKGGSVPW